LHPIRKNDISYSIQERGKALFFKNRKEASMRKKCLITGVVVFLAVAFLAAGAFA